MLLAPKLLICPLLNLMLYFPIRKYNFFKYTVCTNLNTFSYLLNHFVLDARFTKDVIGGYTGLTTVDILPPCDATENMETKTVYKKHRKQSAGKSITLLFFILPFILCLLSHHCIVLLLPPV